MCGSYWELLTTTTPTKSTVGIVHDMRSSPAQFFKMLLLSSILCSLSVAVSDVPFSNAYLKLLTTQHVRRPLQGNGIERNRQINRG